MPRYSTIRTNNLYLQNEPILVVSSEINALAGIKTNLTVQKQLNNIINNTDPATIDSFTEVVADYTAVAALKADIDNPTFTTNITTPKIHTSEIMSQNSHLKLGSSHTNDINLFLNNQETLQFTRNGTEARYTAHGGTGQHRFMNKIFCNDNIDIASGKIYAINGTQIAVANLSDGNRVGVNEGHITTHDGYLTTIRSNQNLTSLKALEDDYISRVASLNVDLQNEITSTNNDFISDRARLTTAEGHITTFDGLLNDANNATQSELNVEKARILVNEGNITNNDSAISAINADNATQTELNVEKARILVNEGNITSNDTRITSVLALSNDDLDTLREIEDAYKAADSSITTTVTNLQSSHNADIIADRARLTTAEGHITTFDGLLNDANNATQSELNVVNGRLTTNETNITSNDNAIAVINADNATQTELNVEKARILVNEGNITSNDSAISAINADNATQTELNVEKARILVNEGNITNNDSAISAINADNATQTELNVEKARILVNEGNITTHDGYLTTIRSSQNLTSLKALEDDYITRVASLNTDLQNEVSATNSDFVLVNSRLTTAEGHITTFDGLLNNANNATQTELNVEKARIDNLEALHPTGSTIAEIPIPNTNQITVTLNALRGKIPFVVNHSLGVAQIPLKILNNLKTNNKIVIFTCVPLQADGCEMRYWGDVVEKVGESFGKLSRPHQNMIGVYSDWTYSSDNGGVNDNNRFYLHFKLF